MRGFYTVEGNLERDITGLLQQILDYVLKGTALYP